MSALWRIFRDDVRLAVGNIVAALVVLGLCLVPAMLAWFGIAGSWDPSHGTAQLKVAVANSDEGYESSLSTTKVNVGARVAEALRGNVDYAWEFVGEDAALDGVCSGEYYAALVLPPDFSSKLTSALAGGDEPAEVDICLNMKENPVALALGGEEGAEAVEGIRAEVVDAVDAMALGLASDIASLSESDQMQELGAVLVARLDSAADNLLTTSNQVGALSSLVSTASSLASSTAGALSETDGDSASQGDSAFAVSGRLSESLDSARQAATSLERALGGSGDRSAAKLSGDLSSLADSVDAVSQSADSVASSVRDAVAGLSGSDDSLASGLKGAGETLDDIAVQLESSARAVDRLKTGVSMAIENGDMDKLSELIGDDASSLAEWLAAPVQVETHEVFPVANYGSSVAPFYVLLSLWVGALLLVLVLEARVAPERLGRYESQAGRPVKVFEHYLGHYLVFAVFALLQATVAWLGGVLLLRIQCASPLLLLAACWVCALAFSGIAYALAVSLGAIGKALFIAMLVVQVVGLGGEYPLQMMSGLHQAVYPLTPFAYGLQALRAAVAGSYGGEYLAGLAGLGVFFLLALLLGLASSRPLARLRVRLDEKAGATGLM